MFFDELQRVAEYDDGDELLHDLSDFDALLGTTDGLGKLVHPRELAPTIARSEWRAGLTRRFQQAGHPIHPEALERAALPNDDRRQVRRADRAIPQR